MEKTNVSRTGQAGAVGELLWWRRASLAHRDTASRTDTYRGQTNVIARSPSGMKLMMATDDFIPFFIFRKVEQLEAMAVTYHTPANCSRTSPVEFGKVVGTCQADLHSSMRDLAAQCRNLPT